jgi:hypothetical protein
MIYCETCAAAVSLNLLNVTQMDITVDSSANHKTKDEIASELIAAYKKLVTFKTEKDNTEELIGYYTHNMSVEKPNMYFAQQLTLHTDKLNTSLSYEKESELHRIIQTLETKYAAAQIVPCDTVVPTATAPAVDEHENAKSPSVDTATAADEQPVYEHFKFAALSVDFDSTAPTARVEYIKTLQELVIYYAILQQLYDNYNFTTYKHAYTNPKYNGADTINHIQITRLVNTQLGACYASHDISTLHFRLIELLQNPYCGCPYLYNYRTYTPQYLEYIKQYKCDCCKDPINHAEDCCMKLLEYFNILDTTITDLIAKHCTDVPRQPINTALLHQITELKIAFNSSVAQLQKDIDSLITDMTHL